LTWSWKNLALDVVVRIQLHGLFAVAIGDELVDFTIVGRRGQQLVALLAISGGGVLSRTAVLEALWPRCVDPGRRAANLAALLSKTRKVIAPLPLVSSQGCLGLRLPSDSYVDTRVAAGALHAAEAALGRRDWRTAWARGLSAVFVLEREFMPSFEGEWVDRERARAADAKVRALRCYARACLELGGSELPSAERSARKLVRSNPIAECDHLLLMEVLSRCGDTGAALHVYYSLRAALRDELGVGPSAATQATFRRLLGAGS
jgi:SARP family transcriptional regulator, regulator of embCAB operon